MEPSPRASSLPAWVASRTRSVGTGRVVAALAGLTLGALGLWALASIPRGPLEFSYRNPIGGNAWWPLPFAPANGFTPEQLSSHVARALFLFPACVLLGFAFQHLRPRRTTPPSSSLVVLVGTLLTAAIAAFVIRGVPLQDDEATYLMQADLFTRGLVADPTYPASAAFDEPFTIFTSTGMSGMYLFGTPMVLAVGLPFGLPWLGQLAMVALAIWAAFRAAARADESVAWLGSVLLALSPMLTFTSAGFLSQPPALAGVAVAILGLQVGSWRGGALVGTGLGFAFAARPQTAGPAGVVLLALYGWRDRRLLAGTVLAGLPWVFAVGLYDHAIMGTPWQLPRAAYVGEMEAFGFGKAVRDYEHTPLKAAALAAVALVRLNGWALGWPISLAGPALWFALGRPHSAVVGPWGAVTCATFLFQAGYAFIGTSETGAIYHYAALPFFAFSTAAALREAGSRWWGGWVRAAAVASVLLGTTTFYVEHALRLSRLAAAIEGPRHSLDLELPAVVFEDVWGARPQAGWVFGIPFRERSPSAPVVRYPRPTRAEPLQHLMERWKDRQCNYLWYDWPSSQYRLSPCSEMSARAPRGNDARAVTDTHSVLRAKGREGLENGGWKQAFPYLRLP
jgi:hypothetical protein